MSIQLPDELAVAGDERIEKRDAAPMKRGHAFGAYRFQRPIRTQSDRNRATPQVDDAARDPLRGCDRSRRTPRTSRLKLTRGERGVAETREETPQLSIALPKSLEQSGPIREAAPCDLIVEEP